MLTADDPTRVFKPGDTNTTQTFSVIITATQWYTALYHIITCLLTFKTGADAYHSKAGHINQIYCKKNLPRIIYRVGHN